MKLPKTVKKPRLELAAMMDVIFLVLFFLVYAMLGMSVQKGSRINLPASTTASPDQAEAINIYMNREGNIILNETAINFNEIAPELKKLASKKNMDNPLIKISGDAELTYQQLYQLLDTLKSAGFSSISLQAKHAPVPK